MGASVRHLRVRRPLELDLAAASYVAQGYAVSARDAMSVTLYRAKRFNPLVATIGFFLCLLPLVVYCLVYASQRDRMVVIQVAAVPGIPPGALLSPDGSWFWDGSTWVPVPVPRLDPENPYRPLF